MGIPNLTLRGSTYWWRRRISVGNRQQISLAISLRTGVFNQARLRAAILSVEVEKLRMAYGERGSAVDPATLKKIFSDALRWQLDRIEVEQLASPVHADVHQWTNRAMAEMWRIMARPDPRWLAEDDERLASAGWTVEQRLLVADLWQENRGQTLISKSQLDAYEASFGFAPTASNMDRIRRTIYNARAMACEEASRRLSSDPAGFDGWMDQALCDSSPFAFEQQGSVGQEPGPRGSAPEPANVAPDVPQPSSVAEDEAVAPIVNEWARNKGTLLTEAAEKCIRAHAREDVWSADTIKQVRTAIRLFDFAAGGDVCIEDLTQEHVKAFYDLCHALPNRWGKTKDEIERGLPASLEYAQILRDRGDGSRVGVGAPTIAKHITWIGTVLSFMDDEGSLTGVRPATPLRLRPKKQMLGARRNAKMTRARDKRANWTKQEIERLLEAPCFNGSAGIDDRYTSGNEVIHDAWYWLPLMFILYGGRSSELTGLPMRDVHEDEAIPYFQVDYHDMRALKNVQSVRKLPIHPELIRLGFLEYVHAMRELEHQLLFPEMNSPKQTSFAKTFYSSIFTKWRAWAYPNGTEWRHQAKGIIKDKDVHSFRGVASSMMKGKVADSVRFDILGHEGENTTQRVYDEEASLEEKLKALLLVSPLTSSLGVHPLKLRPRDRQKFGAKRGRPCAGKS